MQIRPSRAVAHLIVCTVLSSHSLADQQTATLSTKPLQAVENTASTAETSKSKKRVAKLGTTNQAIVADSTEEKKKVAFATLGSPNMAATGKPKYALRTDVGMAPGVGGNATDRVAEVKRLVAAYEGIALRYADGLVLAQTPEEKEALAPRAPSARALRSIAALIAHLVAVDPTDDAALDAMVFLSKFIEVPEIAAILSGESTKGAATKFDLHTELLEHHAANPKTIEAFRRLPRGEQTDILMHRIVEKTFNPEVRWAAGAQLFASHRRNGRADAMEQLAVVLSEDRYLEGVKAGHKLSARQWAVNKVREIRTLGVGQELPEVFGNKLEGGIGNINDYRGKVVVLDVWTTWCGPCRGMIPHHVELTERLKDKPFSMLSVSCDRDQETLEAFLKDTSMPWDHWWVAPESEFKKTLNIASFPTIYVLDHKGVIRYKNIRDEQLEEAVDKLLAEIK